MKGRVQTARFFVLLLPRTRLCGFLCGCTCFAVPCFYEVIYFLQDVMLSFFPLCFEPVDNSSTSKLASLKNLVISSSAKTFLRTVDFPTSQDMSLMSLNSANLHSISVNSRAEVQVYT